MSHTKVFDSYALIAFFQNEPGADGIREILLEAEGKGRKVLLSVVNWGEIYYIIKRRNGESQAEQTMNDISRMAIDIIPADMEITKLAAHFKANHPMSYADCFAAALTKIKKAELVTGDKEFKSVEKEISISWI